VGTGFVQAPGEPVSRQFVETQFRWFTENSDEAPITVSEPNQVANSAQAAMKSGSCLPATAKSAAVLTRREAHQPKATVPAM
jgi:hypothetical protein